MSKKVKRNKKIKQKGGSGPEAPTKLNGGIPSINMSGNLGYILENSLYAAMKIFYTPGDTYLMKDFVDLGEDSWGLFKDVITDLGVD